MKPYKHIVYVLAGIAGGLGVSNLFSAPEKKVAKTPFTVRVPSQSQDGQPLLIIQLPTEKKVDETRTPPQDHLTPQNGSQGTRSPKVVLPDGSMQAWVSTIPTQASLLPHRHPFARLVCNRTDKTITLERQNQSTTQALGAHDQLSLPPNSCALFSADPSNQFHNDVSPTANTQVSVIEFTLPKP